MNEKQMALAVLATGKPLQWVIDQYARDVIAAQRAEQAAHEQRMADAYRQECDALEAWVEERLPGFGERVSFSFDRRNQSPPFAPIIWVALETNAVRLIQDPRGIPGGNHVFFKHGAKELTISMPADEPDENWANFVIAIATVTYALERAVVPAPGEVASQ